MFKEGDRVIFKKYLMRKSKGGHRFELSEGKIVETDLFGKTCNIVIANNSPFNNLNVKYEDIIHMYEDKYEREL